MDHDRLLALCKEDADKQLEVATGAVAAGRQPLQFFNVIGMCNPITGQRSERPGIMVLTTPGFPDEESKDHFAAIVRAFVLAGQAIAVVLTIDTWIQYIDPSKGERGRRGPDGSFKGQPGTLSAFYQQIETELTTISRLVMQQDTPAHPDLPANEWHAMTTGGRFGSFLVPHDVVDTSAIRAARKVVASYVEQGAGEFL